MNDFRRDDNWQRAVRDAVLVPHFYRECATEGRFVTVDKGRLADTLQREMAVDTIVQSRDGAVVAIEEKIVRWPGYEYQSFALETQSCTVPGRERAGWMEYGRPDYLLYAFCRPELTRIYLMDFGALKAWFWPRESTFRAFGPLNTFNRSAGRQVPIAAVKRHVPCWRRDLPPYPGVIEAVREGSVA